MIKDSPHGQTQYDDLVAHFDHPMRHWSRTCPGCLQETIKQQAREIAALKNLLRCIRADLVLRESLTDEPDVLDIGDGLLRRIDEATL